LLVYCVLEFAILDHCLTEILELVMQFKQFGVLEDQRFSVVLVLDVLGQKQFDLPLHMVDLLFEFVPVVVDAVGGYLLLDECRHAFFVVLESQLLLRVEPLVDEVDILDFDFQHAGNQVLLKQDRSVGRVLLQESASKRVLQLQHFLNTYLLISICQSRILKQHHLLLKMRKLLYR